MSVLILDAGNSIIKAKIARREIGELAFPHALQPLTKNEYNTILARAGKTTSLLDYPRVNGKPWIGTRVAFSQGKDRDGNWKPSLFLDAKYFGKTEEDGLQEALSGKGVKFDAKGFLELEKYQTSESQEAEKVVMMLREAKIKSDLVPALDDEPAYGPFGLRSPSGAASRYRRKRGDYLPPLLTFELNPS